MKLDKLLLIIYNLIRSWFSEFYLHRIFFGTNFISTKPTHARTIGVVNAIKMTVWKR